MDMRDVNSQPACKGADSPSFTASVLILHPSKTRQVLRRHCVRVAIPGPVSRRIRSGNPSSFGSWLKYTRATSLRKKAAVRRRVDCPAGVAACRQFGRTWVGAGDCCKSDRAWRRVRVRLPLSPDLYRAWASRMMVLFLLPERCGYESRRRHRRQRRRERSL